MVVIAELDSIYVFELSLSSIKFEPLHVVL